MQRTVVAAIIAATGLAVTTGLGFGQAAPQSRILVVPSDLYAYADSNDCDQVTDFYEGRQGVLHPPFVYVDSNTMWWDTAAAVWCRAGRASGGYTLLFRFGPKSGAIARCPNRVDGQQHIGGLSVVKINQTLDHFRYVDEPTRAGPTVSASGIGIRSEYDGTGAIYYCHEGRWLRWAFH